MYVKLGSGDLNSDPAAFSENSYEVKAFHVHPNYNRLTHNNDIAIITLSNAVDLASYNYRPICLPKQDNFPNRLGTVIGWGSTEYG